MAERNKIVCLFTILIYVTTAAEVNDRYYPRYHLAPPFGWMNDPNGFCIYDNEYNLFYQFNPNSSTEPGIAHWGHAKSSDLFHWEHLPVAMYPDKDYDTSGVFSGSAIVENDKIYIFYTGNVNHPGETPDHIQRQALATSDNGVDVVKYEGNPIIMADEHQPNIRDPKVWEHKGVYYMVLGNSFNNDTLGRVLLYASEDKILWKQVSVLDQSDGFLGYMWECPDFFKLNGKYVLLFSPQGIQPQGDKYRNLYQTGYIIGDFDYETYLFTPLTEFKELDHGHDFYATQTIVDESNKRIVIAWLDMWEEHYPEQADGFNGYMTIPRTLKVTRDLRLLQKPVKTIKDAKGAEIRSGKAGKGDVAVLENKAGEIHIKASKHQDLELILEGNNGSTVLQFVTLSYNYLNGTVTLNRGGEDGIRRTKWRPSERELRWKIFVDASSVELFCGRGEVTFSSRFFPQGPIKIRLGNQTEVHEFGVIEMQRTMPPPSSVDPAYILSTAK